MNEKLANKSLLKTAIPLFGYHIAAVILSNIFVLGLGGLFKSTAGLIICSILILIVYSLPIYNFMWGVGHSDLNKQSFGHIKKDNLRGFKIGLIASIPTFIVAILFILSRFNIFPFNFIVLFKIINGEIWGFMNMISTAFYMPDYSILQTFATAFLTLIPSILCGLFYIVGNKDFSISAHLIYKGDKK